MISESKRNEINMRIMKVNVDSVDIPWKCTCGEYNFNTVYALKDTISLKCIKCNKLNKLTIKGAEIIVKYTGGV